MNLSSENKDLGTVRIITYCIINPMYRVLSVGNYLLPYLLLYLIMPSFLE